MPVEFYYGDPPAEPCDRSIEVVCSAYRRPGPLRVLIQSFLNQEVDNWRLQVLHDGPDDDFNAVERDFAGRGPISFWSSDVRHNDYGHSLRAHGLAQSTGDYVLITNDDNYYVPRFLPFVNGAIAALDPDVVVFDMVHSHKFPGGRFQLGYQTFETCMRVGGIDMGAAVVRGDIARRVGFRGRELEADGHYFRDIQNSATHDGLLVVKIPRVLFVHN